MFCSPFKLLPIENTNFSENLRSSQFYHQSESSAPFKPVLHSEFEREHNKVQHELNKHIINFLLFYHTKSDTFHHVISRDKMISYDNNNISVDKSRS